MWRAREGAENSRRLVVKVVRDGRCMSPPPKHNQHTPRADTRPDVPPPDATCQMLLSLHCPPQGGVSAERAEREALQQEAEAAAAAHRQAFDEMVTAAKQAAATSAKHNPNPMRFRAVPPGG